MKQFLLLAAPALAILLILLGILTLPANPLGWFLILIGIVYIAGIIIVFIIRKDRFWETPLVGEPANEEKGDRSFWLISLGMLIIFYISPLEYLLLPDFLPRSRLMSFIGIVLIIAGVTLFLWARRVLGKNYSGHISVKTGQALVQNGPYQLIRHPAYAGFLLMALGISLGYSSIAGLVCTISLLFPGLLYRMKLEERLLIGHFGDRYRDYIKKTSRMIPGIW